MYNIIFLIQWVKCTFTVYEIISPVIRIVGSFEYDVEFKHLAHQANKTEAERVCRVRYNGSLPDITNYNDHKDLKLYMMKNSIQQSWIGLTKVNYKTPRWINSSEVGE